MPVARRPVAFMHVWDAACETIQSTSARRGAMMGTLACDHPDIEAFIDARRDAQAPWQRLCRAAHETAEPGVLFIDRISAWNNLGYRERIRATNPCGEEPLPAYGACDFGSVNLTAFVSRLFTRGAGRHHQPAGVQRLERHRALLRG